MAGPGGNFYADYYEVDESSDSSAGEGNDAPRKIRKKGRGCFFQVIYLFVLLSLILIIFCL